MSKKWLTTVLLTLVLTLPGSVFSEALRKPGYVPGEILVKFRSGATQSTRNTAHSSHGFRLIRRFNRIRVDHVKISEGWTVEDAIAAYQLQADVEYAEPNYYRYASATPNDPSFGVLWGLDNIGQGGGTFDADIDCPEAWDTQTGNPNVIVAVVDSGVDLDHEDLLDNIWENTAEDWVGGSPGNNGVDDDGNGKIDDYYGWDFENDDNNPDDDNDHGSHVSGTIGAVGDNGVGISGVNWRASIMALKILDKNGSGSVGNEIEAVEYAIDNGARVINASFSGSFYSQTEYDVLWDAGDAGILVAAAAGNSDNDIDLPNQAEYPAGYDLANIVAVAATDRNDALAYFSNYGVTSVDVAAPGVSIYSTTPDGGYQYFSGTSMAAPHVAGLAALIWADDDSLTCGEVKDRILYGVDTKSSLVGKVLTGGRINAYNSINPPASAPDDPSDLEAEAFSASRIDLSWTDNASSEFGFEIERATTSGGPYAHLATVGIDVESYSDTGLSEETTYYYRVRAFNVAGNSGYSNESNATTYLSAPSDLSASPVSSDQINISWTDHSGVESGFRIERKLEPGGTYSEIATVGDNVTTYSNTGLEASTTYYYRVNAYSASGNSEYSNEAYATTSEKSSSSDDGDGSNLVSSDTGDDVGVQPTGDSGGGGGCFVNSVLGGFHDHW